MRFGPVVTPPRLDHDRDVEIHRARHLRRDQITDDVPLFGRDLEQQLVVDLHEHARVVSFF